MFVVQPRPTPAVASARFDLVFSSPTFDVPSVYFRLVILVPWSDFSARTHRADPRSGVRSAILVSLDRFFQGVPSTEHRTASIPPEVR